jgi:anion-transporting  ArsA/GET3 family ATPase
MSKKNNYSDVLFNEIELREKMRHKQKAAKVAEVVSGTQAQYDSCLEKLNKIEDKIKKQQKSLKKYKETGNLKHLEIFDE